MGEIEDLFEELEADVTLEEFRLRVEAKIEEMGGLTDEDTAAVLVAHEIQGDRPIDIADIDPDMEVVTVLGVVQHVGEVRTFERDDGAQGAVVNIEIADNSGSTRAAFWDERATAAADDLDVGDTLRLKARPRDGMRGLELSVTDVRLEEGIDLGIEGPTPEAIDELEPGREGVVVAGEVLRTESIRTFDRDDGSSGRVATVVLGDDTGAVAVSLWDDATDALSAIAVGETARVVGGNVRERDGRIEVHVGGRGRLEPADEQIEYEPIGRPIGSLNEDDVATITGIIRSTDPVRTFDRDNGSEGQVRNVRVQDETGDIRVALWGDRASIDIAPGDEVACIDVTIQEGFRDDLEASANWRSTVIQRENTRREESQPEPDPAPVDDDVTFTGTVIQPGSPIVVDDGTETVKVDWDSDFELGQRVTVRGTRDGDRIDATSVEPAPSPR